MRQLVIAIVVGVKVTDDVSGSTFPVDATINWTATGTLYSFKNHLIQIEGPGVLINARFDATVRFTDIPPGSGHAEGIVTDGVTEYVSGPAYLAILLCGNTPGGWTSRACFADVWRDSRAHPRGRLVVERDRGRLCTRESPHPCTRREGRMV